MRSTLPARLRAAKRGYSARNDCGPFRKSLSQIGLMVPIQNPVSLATWLQKQKSLLYFQQRALLVLYGVADWERIPRHYGINPKDFFDEAVEFIIKA